MGTDPDDYFAEVEEARESGGRDPLDLDSVPERTVLSPSGAHYPVLNDAEADYYDQRAGQYADQFKFDNVSDLQDLDRVLSLELILHRYGIWVTRGQDYWGATIAEKEFNSYIKDLSAELRLVKKSMGLDRLTREKAKGEQFVDYLENLRRRAREFGIMREQQLATGITLMHEVIAKVTTYHNCDAQEREELGLQPEQVLEWIRTDVAPRFNAVDAHFRANSQKTWVGQL